MTDVFDEFDALEKTAGDRELLSEVIRFTLEDVPSLLEGLSEALDSGKWTEASRLAHKIKGTAGACGAGNLYLKALDLEMAGRDGNPACVETLPAVSEAFEAFRLHPGVRKIASLDPAGKRR